MIVETEQLQFHSLLQIIVNKQEITFINRQHQVDAKTWQKKKYDKEKTFHYFLLVSLR